MLLNLLLVLFIGLKLTGYIDWEWHLVLMPFIVKAILVLMNLLISGDE